MVPPATIPILAVPNHLASLAQQASCLAENLKSFEQEYGIAFTDKLYPSPFPEFSTLQWSYPYNWPPLAIMTVEALDKGRRIDGGVAAGDRVKTRVRAEVDRQIE